MLRNLFFVALGALLAHTWATIDQDTLDAILGISVGLTFGAILLAIIFADRLLATPNPPVAFTPHVRVQPVTPTTRKPTRTLPRSVPVYQHNPNYVDFEQISHAMRSVVPAQSIMGLSTKRMATA
ncbi:MAG TPA: hypothetical protein P5282_07070 [Anaerolineaceae bacterium]|nr:hypothetical protein [Myxococcota bacterium]HRS74685.1 hypothetical protein [Anaerolineaceae bacterium]HRV18443.1 hypothetical protein [Myxococcota bacterium]